LADLRTDRRLRAKYFFAGAREAALAGNLQESNKLIEVHAFG
jgi:hypothetical protein